MIRIITGVVGAFHPLSPLKSQKAAYFLAHDSEREKIAEAGRKAAEQYFSYDVLLPKLFDDIEG